MKSSAEKKGKLPKEKKVNSRIQNRENTKEKLLKASLEIFSQKGFHGTSMEMIAKRAEVSKGLAYSYFESKNQILSELLFSFWDERRVVFTEILNGKLTPKKKCEAIIEHSLSFLNGSEEEVNKIRLLFSIALQPGFVENIKPFIDEHRLKFLDEMQSIERLLISLGSKDPQTERYFLKTMIHGILFLFLIKEENYPFDKIKKMLLDRYK